MQRDAEGRMRTEDIASRGGETSEPARREGGAPPTADEQQPDRPAAANPATAGQQGATPQAAGDPAAGRDDESTPLLPEQDASDFERRWRDLQVGFVDEPQRSVQEADGLVAEVMQRLADGFARERRDLESQWASGGEVSTEDLRVSLQRYRSFFNRLLRSG